MGSSMTSSEDYAVQNLRLATGHLMAAIGFNSTSNECLDIMTDLMCRFMKKVSAESKYYAEHAGRTQLALSDLTLAFRKMRFNTVEMYDYMKHINKQPTKHVSKPVPLFPVARPNSKTIYGPQPSETELETRPEYIPSYFPAVHPESTQESIDYLDTVEQKPSTSSTEKKGTKFAMDFPCFYGKTSLDLSLQLLEKETTAPPLTSRKNDSSATGITSSANLSSRNLTDSPSLSSAAKRKLGIHRERTYTPSPVPHKTYSPVPPTLSKRDEKPPELIPAKSEDKPFKLKLKFDTPKTPQKPKEESLSPMPTLEKGETADYDGYELPLTPKIKENGDSRNGSQPLTPALSQRIVDNDLIASNMELFASLKAEAERERLKKLEKEEKDKKREKRREEQKQKKLKKAKEEEIKVKAALAEAERRKAEEEERKRKLVEEEERKRREEEEKRVKDEEKRRLEEERRKEEEEQAKKQLQKLERERKLLEEAKKQNDNKPLKILISKPKSDRPSVAYSPTIVGHVNDDEDTTPFYESGVEENGPTTFPLNISLSSNETPSKEKKKHKKKDKERDSSRDRIKDKKRDKDHKEKKKKREKDRSQEDRHEKDRKESHKDKHKEKSEKRISEKIEELNKTATPVKIEPEMKIPTLKIRLGNQTPSSSDMSSPPIVQEAPVKLKFKVPSPDKKEERTVPPIQIRMPVAPTSVSSSEPKTKDYEVTPEKKKLVTKAELKASPSEFVKDAQREKEEKRKRKEEKRRKEQEEKEKEKQRQADKEREKNLEALRKKQEEQSLQRKTSKKSKTAPTPTTKTPTAPPPVAKIATFDFLGTDVKPAPKKEESVATDEEEIWICPACSVAWTEGADMVACDQCDDWFHWHCVGLLVAPAPDKKWYCQKCELKLKKKSEKRFSTKSDAEPSAKKKKKS